MIWEINFSAFPALSLDSFHIHILFLHPPMTTPLLLTIALALSAQAATLIEDLGLNYNAVILGDLTIDSADTEGRQLTTGDFTTDISWLYTIGTTGASGAPQNPPSAGRDDMVVGGDYTHSGGVGEGFSSLKMLSLAALQIPAKSHSIYLAPIPLATGA